MGLCTCFREDYLDKLISKNTPIHVCKACSDKRLMSPDDLMQASEMSPAPVLVDMMASPDNKVSTL
jgi:sulfur relay (sulfurtransferase) complex TusBCD TusD component (DsrE family)